MIDNELIRKAESGDVDAIILLGSAYYQLNNNESGRKAFDLFNEAISLEPNNSTAIYKLGNCYNEGVGVEEDVEKSLELYRKAAILGNQSSQYRLATELKKQNDIECLIWYQKAYESGVLDALYDIANIYNEGEAVPRDAPKYIEYLKKSDAAGNSSATLDLACAYLTGECIARNEEKGVELLHKALNAGNKNAAKLLSIIYRDGNGVEADIEKSIEWAKKAAELGDSDMIFYYAMAYFNGDSQIDEDKSKAVEFFKMASDAGSISAIKNLGICYYNGYGVDCDKMKAVEWFEKAAQIGDIAELEAIKTIYSEIDPCNASKKYFELAKSIADDGYVDAMVKVHVCYREGDGTEKNIEKAMQYLNIAADNENADACFLKGVYYYNGDYGLERDRLKAVSLWEIAMNGGNGEAPECLAKCYLIGEGVEKNITKALELLEKAKEFGSIYACLRLGQEYDEDGLAETNYEKAFENYTKAYEMGSADGACCLGNMYENGHGVKKDVAKALELYEYAADHGCGRGMAKVGTFFYAGVCVTSDVKVAVQYFENAIKAGYDKAVACLDIIYKQFNSPEVDPQKAFRHNLRRAAQGNADAQFFVYRAYNGGVGVEKDQAKAEAWLKNAADSGQSTAQRIKGIELYNINKFPEAASYLEKASIQGDLQAKCCLAEMYSSGKGVEKDYKKSETLYKDVIANKKSEFYETALVKLAQMYYVDMEEYNLAFPLWVQMANEGITSAKNILGTCYYMGHGVEKDDSKALYWFRQAAAEGDEGARNNAQLLEELLQSQTGEQSDPGQATSPNSSGGCYVATAVYGSYDCPEVWTLRRYRDYNLAETWYGRSFIKTYYAVSPTLVKWFGQKSWFRTFWKSKLDKIVRNLQDSGVESTPYDDRTY